MTSFWTDVKQESTPNLTSLLEPLLTHAAEHSNDKPPNDSNPKPPQPKNKKTVPKQNNKNKKQPLKASKKSKTNLETNLTIDNFM